jgi:hypothetical protein
MAAVTVTTIGHSNEQIYTDKEKKDGQNPSLQGFNTI